MIEYCVCIEYPDDSDPQYYFKEEEMAIRKMKELIVEDIKKKDFNPYRWSYCVVEDRFNFRESIFGVELLMSDVDFKYIDPYAYSEPYNNTLSLGEKMEIEYRDLGLTFVGNGYYLMKWKQYDMFVKNNNFDFYRQFFDIEEVVNFVVKDIMKEEHPDRVIAGYLMENNTFNDAQTNLKVFLQKFGYENVIDNIYRKGLY